MGNLGFYRPGMGAFLHFFLWFDQRYWKYPRFRLLVSQTFLLAIVGCSAGTVEFINLSMVRWPIQHIYYLPEKIQTPSMATPLHIFNKPIDKGGLCSPLAKAHCTSGTSWCSWGHDISAPLGWYFMWSGNSIPSSNWLPSFCWEYGHIKTLQIAPDKTTG